jgi:hypothetical protein
MPVTVVLIPSPSVFCLISDPPPVLRVDDRQRLARERREEREKQLGTPAPHPGISDRSGMFSWRWPFFSRMRAADSDKQPSLTAVCLQVCRGDREAEWRLPCSPGWFSVTVTSSQGLRSRSHLCALNSFSCGTGEVVCTNGVMLQLTF